MRLEHVIYWPNFVTIRRRMYIKAAFKCTLHNFKSVTGVGVDQEETLYLHWSVRLWQSFLPGCSLPTWHSTSEMFSSSFEFLITMLQNIFIQCNFEKTSKSKLNVLGMQSLWQLFVLKCFHLNKEASKANKSICIGNYFIIFFMFHKN